MAESFSVKAILSAKDSSFTSTLNRCSNVLDGLDRRLSGFSFGVLTGAGQAAFNAVTNSVTDLISEVDASNASWKTFEGNMKMLGKGADEINGVKKELQKFATETIYSASDMASTYAQLAAVGVENTTELVKGFGGLAAAAENPQQAMKTLSQQATQLAAKPKVAWADFKLMLEQSPAGMAAVAEEMCMSLDELVAKIQDTKGAGVKTKKFFDAIAKTAGTGTAFEKMATQYKTAGQAMDGLVETASTKLQPAFEVLSIKAIDCISNVADELDEIDAEGLARKTLLTMKKGEKYVKAFKESFSGVGDEVGEAVGAVRDSLAKLNGEFGSAESVDDFKSAMDVVAGGIKTVADLATEHSDKIAWLISNLPKIAIALKGFSVAKKVAPFVSTFAGGIANLASKGFGGIAGKLFKVSEAQETVGRSSSSSAKKMLTSAKTYALTGVAVLTIAAGFALLAYSAIQLANAGPLAIGVMAGLVVAVGALSIGMMAMMNTISATPKKLATMGTTMLSLGAAVLMVSTGFLLLSYAATNLASGGGLAIGVMVGMVAAIALLAVGAAAVAPALTAGAAGLIAFGAAVVLVGTGALLAAASISVVAGVLPTVSEYGLQGALAITALGGSLIVFAAGATVAGSASMILGAGLVVAGAGMVVLTAGMAAGAVGALAMAGSLKLVSSQIKDIAKNAKNAQSSLKSMQSSVKLVESGLNALESKAKTALKTLINSFDDSAKSAKTAGKNVGSGFADSMQPGLKKAESNMKTTATNMKTAFNNAANQAKTAGKNTGSGFTRSLQDGLKSSDSVASSAVSSVIEKLESGESSAYNAGAYISQGFALGMKSCLEEVRTVAAELAAIAQKAIETKAKIHSPSDVTWDDGEYFGEGWVGGILSKVKDARKAAEKLVSLPNVRTPKLAGNFGMELSEDYEYYRNAQYTIVVPVEIDGRETAKVIAPYTEEELNKRQTRANRKQGKV